MYPVMGEKQMSKRYYTVLYITINYGKLGLQLSLKENQKRTLVIKRKSGHMVF